VGPAPRAASGPRLCAKKPAPAAALAAAALAVATLGGALGDPLGAQASPAPAPAPAPAPPPAAADSAARVLRSTPAERPPAVDGRDDDPVWRLAPAASDFRVFDPSEGAAPRFRTEARVAHDARHLYVFVRAFDPRPDSLVAILSRRDVRTPSDQIKVMVDSYHDRRTGYEFAVNPAGVKRDYYTYDDSREDVSWDAVWDVAVRTDSLGWAAEFRIPLSQLRFPARGRGPGGAHAFGLMVMRDVGRANERLAWPAFRRSRPGIASQFGDLVGLTGLAAPQRLEVAPYALARNVSVPAPAGFARAQRQQAGADVKYGLTSNLTVDLSVNPDFGQVEADPAVLNLTAFEQFFPERRPFFLEGTGIFQAGSDPARLFYSRRIGRAPQLAGLAADPLAPAPPTTTILGAGKLTGRLARGTSVGVLGALTGAERAGRTLVEPRAGFAAARVAQDLRRGETGVGAMLTGVRRGLDDPEAAARLRRSAVAGGLDLRHRFLGGRYQVNATVQASQVAGAPAAIARTQRSGVHYYQRPGDRLRVDTTRTRLAGTAFGVDLNKTAGVFRVNSAYQRVSPGFETNDLGYLPRADEQSASGEFMLRSVRPRSFWRNATATFFTSHRWTAAGMPLYHNVDGWAEVEFRSQRRAFVEYWVDQWGGSRCDRCAFGGPAVRLSPDHNVFLQLTDDPRRRVSPLVAAVLTVGDEGRSVLWRVRPLVRLRPAGNVAAEVGARYERNRDASQWVANRGGGDTVRSFFAPLDQHTLSAQLRLDWTVRPALSVQLYAEPFVSRGAYGRVRALAAPDAPRWADRFRPADGAEPADDFDARQFRSNAVLRWEYRPGSALFVVWQQGRNRSDPAPGRFDAWRDVRGLFGARPDNTLLVKASYWIGR
jgi:hypothetical protein